VDYEPCRAQPDRPCLNEVVERHEGVTVEVLRCRRCGRLSTQWMRPEIAALEEATEAQVGKTLPKPPPEPKEYWPAVEHWLQRIHDLKVRSVVNIALIDDEAVNDVVSVYDAGPSELAMLGGLLIHYAANPLQDDFEEEDEADDD
jgi:hypothetical protein